MTNVLTTNLDTKPGKCHVKRVRQKLKQSDDATSQELEEARKDPPLVVLERTFM
jgi:hypothetical protein